MPTLNWIGKDAVINHDKEVPFRLLKKIKAHSVGTNSQNLIIHGDNLEALKALMPYYMGKIKCIYIDPPYNTGNENWVYNDKVNSPKIKKWLGKVVGGESEDLCRHDKWLCMMYPRLKLLRDLLSEDGVIVISIDDNEQAHLRLLMDDIFGNNNLLLNGVVNRASEIASNNIISKHEYFIIYTKNNSNFALGGNERYTISRGTVGNEDQTMPVIVFPKGLKCTNVKDGIYNKPRQIIGSKENIDSLDPIIVKDGHLYKNVRLKARWRSSNDMRKFFSNDCNPTVAKINGIIEEIYLDGDRFMPQIKKKVTAKIPSLLLKNKRGSKDLELLDLQEKFDYPKSMDYIKRIISFIASSGDIVLDSFAGSGTTGHAVLDLNKEDGGNRKFILVEMEEKVIKDITTKRIAKAIDKYGYEGGFEYCELDKPLFDENGKIDEECSFEQLATYIYFIESNTNLDKKSISKNYIGNYNNTEYYLLYKEKGKNILTKDFLKSINSNKNKKIVYADKCLIDEKNLIKHNIIFKQIPYEIKVF